MRKNKILVILGPTASGKSDLAVRLALRLNSGQAKKYGFNGAEIISADSRQVYKNLNIGTGKITKKEMRGVPHHLLDVVSPRTQFSVSSYKKLGEKAIEKILKKGKLPIICGGTGLYIDTLLGEVNFPEVAPNPKLRVLLEKKSTKELFEVLKKLDKERAQNIDTNNPRRLVRAIEVASHFAKAPWDKKAFQSRSDLDKKEREYDVLKIGIKVEPEELKERINKRINKWFKQGLIKEVENLHNKGLSWKRMNEIGLEYKLVSKHLMSRTVLDISKLKKEMRITNYQYSKRQMTWFKRDKKIVWISPNNNPSDILNFLKNS